jgi:hypothetical protein
MCGAHRQEVLKKVSDSLKVESKTPMRLISTQCIEAGVNLDAPVMFRSLAPLESIAQAAGRCNRHGKRNQPGRVIVFKPEPNGKPLYPMGAYSKAANATETFLRQKAEQLSGNVLNNPQLMREYYRDFYSLDPSVTEHKELSSAILAGSFVEIAKHYRLIEGDQINILVPFKKTEFDQLVQDVEASNRPPRFVSSWIRRARQFSVTIHRPTRDKAIWNYLNPVQFFRSRHVDIDQADWFVLLDGDLYDETLGLKTEVEFDGINY